MFKNLLSALFLTASISTATAAEITTEDQGEFLTVSIVGEIVADDYNKWVAVTKDPVKPIKQVWLNSRGGSLREALFIATDVYDKKYDTVVPPKNYKGRTWCVSACSLIAVAGNNKFMTPNSLLGVHSAFVKKKNPSKEEIEAASFGNTLVVHLMGRMGVHAWIAHKWVSTRPTTMYMITAQDNATYGLGFTIVDSTLFEGK